MNTFSNRFSSLSLLNSHDLFRQDRDEELQNREDVDLSDLRICRDDSDKVVKEVVSLEEWCDRDDLDMPVTNRC